MSKITKLNIDINFPRVIIGFFSTIGGGISYLANRNSKVKSKKVKILSLLSVLAGVILLGIEAEKSFKPIEEDIDDENKINDEE